MTFHKTVDLLNELESRRVCLRDIEFGIKGVTRFSSDIACSQQPPWVFNSSSCERPRLVARGPPTCSKLQFPSANPFIFLMQQDIGSITRPVPSRRVSCPTSHILHDSPSFSRPAPSIASIYSTCVALVLILTFAIMSSTCMLLMVQPVSPLQSHLSHTPNLTLSPEILNPTTLSPKPSWLGSFCQRPQGTSLQARL